MSRRHAGASPARGGEQQRETARGIAREAARDVEREAEREAALEAAGVAPRLSVGELARRSGVAVSTLHFYESRGLIVSMRTEGNQRRYPRAMLRRVAFIRVAQRVGIGLSEIGAALATLPVDAAPARADWARLSAGWRSELDARIAQLERLRDQLDDCIGCGCLSIDRCKLRNPLDRLAEDGPGPRRLLVGSDGDGAA